MEGNGMTVIDESTALLDEELDLINGGLIRLSREEIEQIRKKLWERNRPGRGYNYIDIRKFWPVKR